MTAAEHEAGFLSVLGPNRARFEAMMGTEGRRHKVLDKLAHANPFPDRFLLPGPPQAAAVAAELVRAGAPAQCYVISLAVDTDRRFFDLEDALDRLFPDPSPFVVSCIPGRLLYYRSEAPNADSWLVVSPGRGPT